MRLPLDEEEKVDIQMSPLIDCVFLLLIFFLVTTMMKKWEMQIPLSLPEMTSSLSTTRSGENTVIIAVDEDKQVYEVVHHDAYTGENDYLPIGDLDTYLNGLREKVGTEISIDVAAYRSVPVSTVIEIFDKCMPIRIILDWEVSIRPCEFKNFSKIINNQTKPIGKAA